MIPGAEHRPQPSSTPGMGTAAYASEQPQRVVPGRSCPQDHRGPRSGLGTGGVNRKQEPQAGALAPCPPRPGCILPAAPGAETGSNSPSCTWAGMGGGLRSFRTPQDTWVPFPVLGKGTAAATIGRPLTAPRCQACRERVCARGHRVCHHLRFNQTQRAPLECLHMCVHTCTPLYMPVYTHAHATGYTGWHAQAHASACTCPFMPAAVHANICKCATYVNASKSPPPPFTSRLAHAGTYMCTQTNLHSITCPQIDIWAWRGPALESCAPLYCCQSGLASVSLCIHMHAHT